MDLELISNNKEGAELYLTQMEARLNAISPALVQENIWSKTLLEEIPCFVNEYIAARSPISFVGIPETPSLELKLYWANLLSDPRMNSQSIVQRRRLPMSWLMECCENALQKFEVTCIADIPHPEFPLKGSIGPSKKGHNKDLITSFILFDKKQNPNRSKVKINYTKSGELQEKEYTSPNITVIGDFHKKIIIQREQFQSLRKRNVLLLDDLYSEYHVRYKDLQKQKSSYVNLFQFPEWLRDAVREHILDKISHDELGPKTLPGYVGRFKHFSNFMHEKFERPSPSSITDVLIGDMFVDWGNAKGLYGRNWYTDTLAMLATAARKWPDIWPSLTVSGRSSKKIKNVHYKEGLGRLGYAQEGGGRAYSQRIVDELYSAVKHAPSPTPCVFTLIMGAGMRSEDGHAILFDCLDEDPNDADFMLLTFWQSKVSKWNVKPLHKNNKDHAQIINAIEEQRSAVIKRHGKKTKYLFPVFNGTHESFTSPAYTMGEIKKQCVSTGVLSDDGSPLSFSWHPLRHTKGTSMAKDGHDILSIMMELGHASPDMATAYINNRLELKKKALLQNGGGRFYTIEGEVDESVANLLVRKGQIRATRVCGGACTMPAQIGDWCEHANACYTCKHYRADAKDVDFFKNEKGAVINLIEEQQEELVALQENQQSRMSEITGRRLAKNKEIYKRLNDIVSSIEADGQYQGREQQARKTSLEDK